MQNILVPVDFSKDSMNALNHGIYLANTFNQSLRIIHVRKDKNYDLPFVLKDKDKDKEYAKTTEEFCEEIVNKYKAKYQGGGDFDFVIRTGRIYKGITEQAEKDGSLMIVMGTHGISGFEEFWLGSNAYRVVCKAPCPVMTIRHGFRKKKIKKIILPIDARQDTRVKVPFTCELAQALKAEVHVIDVRETNARDVIARLNRYANQSAEYLEKRGVKTVRDSFKGSNVADLTIAYAVHVGAELISMVSNHRGNPMRMYLSSEAQEMVNHSPIPVLSVHPSYAKF
ncbi:MAG: universal stress protein [Bacteroidales bacterium]|nr:universal stress protein [Bacteroidales bacterium]